MTAERLDEFEESDLYEIVDKNGEFAVYRKK